MDPICKKGGRTTIIKCDILIPKENVSQKIELVETREKGWANQGIYAIKYGDKEGYVLRVRPNVGNLVSDTDALCFQNRCSRYDISPKIIDYWLCYSTIVFVKNIGIVMEDPGNKSCNKFLNEVINTDPRTNFLFAMQIINFILFLYYKTLLMVYLKIQFGGQPNCIYLTIKNDEIIDLKIIDFMAASEMETTGPEAELGEKQIKMNIDILNFTYAFDNVLANAGDVKNYLVLWAQAILQRIHPKDTAVSNDIDAINSRIDYVINCVKETISPNLNKKYRILFEKHLCNHLKKYRE